MVCRTTRGHKFGARSGFKQYGPILTKRQSLLTKTKNLSEAENVQTLYILLGYRIDLYFHDHKLAIDIEKNDIGTEILTMK